MDTCGLEGFPGPFPRPQEGQPCRGSGPRPSWRAGFRNNLSHSLAAFRMLKPCYYDQVPHLPPCPCSLSTPCERQVVPWAPLPVTRAAGSPLDPQLVGSSLPITSAHLFASLPPPPVSTSLTFLSQMDFLEWPRRCHFLHLSSSHTHCQSLALASAWLCTHLLGACLDCISDPYQR